MMIRQQRLEYKNHKEEIRALNKILTDIQHCHPIPPELCTTIEMIIERLDQLTIAQDAVLRDYDPQEQFL